MTAMTLMRRGDLVTVALPGDYGKPRPALVIQSDLFAAHPSVTVLPVTSKIKNTPLFRIALAPSPLNGLQQASEIMVDKAQSISRTKVGAVFGRLSDEHIVAVNRALALFLNVV